MLWLSEAEVTLSPGEEVTGCLEHRDQLAVGEGQEGTESNSLISALADGG